MDGRQAIDGFNFNNHLVFDDKIGSKALIIYFSIETNRYRHLPLNGKAFGCEGIGEHDFVN